MKRRARDVSGLASELRLARSDAVDANVVASDRDFAGYRDDPPPFRWPNGAQLALSIVVNIEEGAELALSMGDESNEFVYEISERIDGVRDFLHWDYAFDWPVFNFADCCLVVGAGLLLFQAFTAQQCG